MTTRCLPLWLLGALALTGCPHRPPGEFTAIRFDQADLLLKAALEVPRRLGSISTAGTLELRQGARRLKVRVLVLAARPAYLRFESESFFEQPLSILVTDGMRFSLSDLDAGHFVTGSATSANIGRVLPLPMDGPEVVGLLLGDLPLIAYATSDLRFASDSTYQLLLRNDREEQEILLRVDDLRPVEIQIRRAGKVWYRLIYEEWWEKTGQALSPKTLRLEIPQDSLRMILHFKEFTPNLTLEPGLFLLTPPEGVPIEVLP